MNIRERDPTYKIFCGNLSPSTTGENLRALFTKHGKVIEAVVMAGKNYGFVHMSTEGERNKAISQLHGYNLNGEKLTVQRSVARKVVYNPGRQNIVGKGVGSLDDFDTSEYQENGNYSEKTIPALMKQNIPSPSFYNNGTLPTSNSESSGRPSPLTLSNSHTPEHFYKSVTNASVCLMCNEPYDIVNRVPKILSCSHTFCKPCLSSKIIDMGISCPEGCPYITTLNNLGVLGLTTNQTVPMQNGSYSNRVTPEESIENLMIDKNERICLKCAVTPPYQACYTEAHILGESKSTRPVLYSYAKQNAAGALTQLKLLESSRKKMKERNRVSFHSLAKFTNELRNKIEREDNEQAVFDSITNEIESAIKTLDEEIPTNQLLAVYLKMQDYESRIATESHHNAVKITINQAIESVVLNLKPPFVDGCLNQFGLSTSEEFSMGASLEENFNRGNYANVMLIYLLSDLLSTRCKAPSLPATEQDEQQQQQQQHQQQQTAPASQGFAVNGVSPSDSNGVPDRQHHALPPPSSSTSTDVDINQLIRTTEAIESNGLDRRSADEGGAPTAVVSSALSLGISNISLFPEASAPSVSVSSDTEDGEEGKPFSYLDAAKKPAKLSSQQQQQRAMVKLIPNALKSVSSVSTVAPNKTTTHCWMTLSIEGELAGRVVFQLRHDKAPKMCDNFVGLCTGSAGYGYKGTHFFKNGDGFLVGGDVENDDGSGGYSIYDRQKFEADLCPLKDDVAMVRFKGIGTSDAGRGMVGSQFMIWYTVREFKKFSFSLVFGKVVDGLDIIQRAATHSMQRSRVMVEDCGAI